MPLYAPIVNGETAGLRYDAEHVLSDSPTAISDRLNNLERTIEAEADLRSTFGVEVEAFLTALDPNAASKPDPDSLYLELIRSLGGDSNMPIPKGAVLLAGSHLPPVMTNEYINSTYNDDQPGSGIIEVRSAPGSAIETCERYWKIISAIGELAAKYNLLGTIITTHVNVANYTYGRAARFTDFLHMDKELTAATQYNLRALRSLQLDANLEEQPVVLQAWPDKNGSTAIHRRRLEIRHTMLGIVDPRIDMLAAMDGLLQVIRGSTPPTAQRMLRPAHLLEFDAVPREVNDNFFSLLAALELHTIYDQRWRQLVLPAVMECRESVAPAVKQRMDAAVQLLSDGAEEDGYANNAVVFRTFVNELHGYAGSLSLRHPEKYSAEINKYVSRLIISTPPEGEACYTTPAVIRESPKAAVRQRSNTMSSPTVQRILGPAYRTLVTAPEAVERQRQLVDQHTVRFETD